VSAALFLRRALSADVKALAALERASSLHPGNEAQLAAEIGRLEPDTVLVMEGRAGVRAWCAYRLAVGEVTILNLAVDPRERRRGLGGFLLSAVLRRATRAEASRALLEVRISNEPARSLYAKFGFMPIGARKSYYVDPLEDALVLARLLGGRPDLS
jgi:[ribosomal protein S18]-alanine N-acetyltransferase